VQKQVLLLRVYCLFVRYLFFVRLPEMVNKDEYIELEPAFPRLLGVAGLKMPIRDHLVRRAI